MKGSTVSRRVSEFAGVTLFAAALIWIIALASYEPTDPAWFFSTGTHAAPVNFAGRVGAFLAELSFQLFGYASYLIPAEWRVTPADFERTRVSGARWWGVHTRHGGMPGTDAAYLMNQYAAGLPVRFGPVTVWSGQPDSAATRP